MTKKGRDRYAGLLVGIARAETKETIASVAKSLLDDGWNDRYSEKYLTSDRLPQLVERLRANPDIESARSLFDELEAEWDADAKGNEHRAGPSRSLTRLGRSRRGAGLG